MARPFLSCSCAAVFLCLVDVSTAGLFLENGFDLHQPETAAVIETERYTYSRTVFHEAEPGKPLGCASLGMTIMFEIKHGLGTRV